MAYGTTCYMTPTHNEIVDIHYGVYYIFDRNCSTHQVCHMTYLTTCFTAATSITQQTYTMMVSTSVIAIVANSGYATWLVS